jgi:hypothetical protein
MKKASIAVALVLVFGLFAAAFSLAPANAQYGTSPSGTTSTENNTNAGNTTASSTGSATTSSNTTSTNATTASSGNATGSTFSARGSIASLTFDIGATATNQTGTSSSNATSTNNTTASSTGNMTSSGNATGNAALSQTIVGGNNSTSAAGNATGMTGTNATTASSGNATSSSNATSTASSGGNTTTSAQAGGLPYIVSGDWNLGVKNGKVSNFKANFSMVHTDGTGKHTHDITNFQSSNGSAVTLNQTGTMFIFGTADISANGQPKWTGVNTLITIDHLNAFSISFASQDSDDHFKGQPVYGVVHSLKDQSGKEMIQTSGTSTAGNATGGNTTTSGNTAGNSTQSALNQAGSAISNATEGVKKFLNGTG